MNLPLEANTIYYNESAFYMNEFYYYDSVFYMNELRGSLVEVEHRLGKRRTIIPTRRACLAMFSCFGSCSKYMSCSGIQN